MIPHATPTLYLAGLVKGASYTNCRIHPYPHKAAENVSIRISLQW